MDVYDVNGNFVKTIIADYLVEVSPNVYKIFDAKSSIITDLTTKPNLLSTCTENQKIVYPLINNGNYSRIFAKGKEARKIGLLEKLNEITIENNIELIVNDLNDINNIVRRTLN